MQLAVPVGAVLLFPFSSKTTCSSCSKVDGTAHGSRRRCIWGAVGLAGHDAVAEAAEYLEAEASAATVKLGAVQHAGHASIHAFEPSASDSRVRGSSVPCRPCPREHAGAPAVQLHTNQGRLLPASVATCAGVK
jgi:hypothetical protein